MREEKKAKKLQQCKKCGVELSYKEFLNGGTLNYMGSIIDTTGMCDICRGDIKEKMYGTREREEN